MANCYTDGATIFALKPEWNTELKCRQLAALANSIRDDLAEDSDEENWGKPTESMLENWGVSADIEKRQEFVEYFAWAAGKCEPTKLSCTFKPEKEGLYVKGDEQLDPDGVMLVTRLLMTIHDPFADALLSLEWANTCDKPWADHFGGGVCVWSKGKEAEASTRMSKWLIEQSLELTDTQKEQTMQKILQATPEKLELCLEWAHHMDAHVWAGLYRAFVKNNEPKKDDDDDDD